MTWNTLYSATLNANTAVGGSNFNYVVEIPAIGASDAHVRIALHGPTSGTSRVQSMYLGHGSGYGFDGAQVQVKVGGLSSFSLSSGVTYSDPIPTASFGYDPTKKLLLAYGLLSGDNYRVNTSASSAHSMYWKAGTGDAATTAKTGYTTGASRTAMVGGVQFVDVVPTITEPVPEEECDCEHSQTDNSQQVLDGQRHSTGDEIVGEEGKHTVIQFVNPAGTGKIGLLYEVEITPAADTIVSLRSYTGLLGAAFPVKCNLMFGAGQASMHGRVSKENSIPGYFHSIHKLRGGQRNIIKLDTPLIGLVSGATTAVIVLHSKGVGCVGNIQWREIPA